MPCIGPRKALRSAAFIPLALLLALSGCGSGGGQTDTDPPNPIPDQPVLARGCDWILVFDPTQPGLGNVAFPDAGSRYWVAFVDGNLPAGSRLRIQGQFPDARYSALHAHDGNLNTLDALADYEFKPDADSKRLFLSQTQRDIGASFGGRYTAFLRIDEAQDGEREQNTLYRAPPAAGHGEVRRRSALIYRTYLSQGGNQGRVALPQLTLETPEGSGRLPRENESSTCAEVAVELRRDGAVAPGSANLIDPTPALPNPFFRAFRGLVGTPTASTGIGYNEHNGFMFAKTDRRFGELLLVRGRAPSYTSQLGAPLRPQVRYWSVCHAGFSTQRVYTCLADRDTPLDDEGYYTVVFAGDGVKPEGTLPGAGFSFIPWGPEDLAAVTVRELLADPGYAESTVTVPPLTNPALHKGEYMPLATFCSREVYASAVAMGPRAAFEICDASRRPLDVLP
jgi:hypothetical protein